MLSSQRTTERNRAITTQMRHPNGHDRGFSHAFDFLFSPRVQANLGKDRNLFDKHEYDTQHPTHILFCFVFNKPFMSQHSGMKATATTNLELQGFYPSTEFHTLGHRKRKFEVSEAAQRQSRRPCFVAGQTSERQARPVCAVWETRLEGPFVQVARQPKKQFQPHDFRQNLAKSGSVGKKI